MYANKLKGGKCMDKNLFINASEVVDMLEVSKPYAYKLIQQFNKELAEKGYQIIPGRVSRKYFKERMYGLSE